MSEQFEGGFEVDEELFEEENKPVPFRTKLKNEVFDWLRIFSIVIVIIVLIFTFILKPATIEGSSMENTLEQDQKVLITNLFYTPRYGDIVVISRNVDNTYEDGKQRDNLPIIKRVIATEGQVVDIKDGYVYVDGVRLDETYIKDYSIKPNSTVKYNPPEGQKGVEFPLTVKKGCVFVLGDNRLVSKDSRYPDIGDCGMIDTRYILGHVVLRVVPINLFGTVK